MADRPTLVIVPDGMADWAQPELDNRTPLEVADTPHLDELCTRGRVYRLQNIPEECPADSGIANMALLGYDPREFYLGRGPMEALNLGIQLEPGEIAYRCNLVSVDDNDVLTDYSASNLETAISTDLFEALDEEYSSRGVRFYPGLRYRGVMVMEGEEPADCFFPHDEMGRPVDDIWPRGRQSEKIKELMLDSRRFLESYRAARPGLPEGARHASMIWPWGGGRAREIPSVQERYHRSGHVVAGVDLINGLGVAVGLRKESVPGATGDYETDMAGKARRALEVLQDNRLVFLHVEAPDEAGHDGNIPLKIEMIERVDRDIIQPVLEAWKERGFEVTVGPDHYTPIQERTHVGDPVPYLMVDGQGSDHRTYSESGAKDAPLIERGWEALAAWYSGDPNPFRV